VGESFYRHKRKGYLVEHGNWSGTGNYRTNISHDKSRDISNFSRYLKMFMYLIHVFSRNRERSFAEPRLESTALDVSERSTADSSQANCQYVYTTGKKIPSLSLIHSSDFVRKRDLQLNLNLTTLTLKWRSILVINKQLFLLPVCQ